MCGHGLRAWLDRAPSIDFTDHAGTPACDMCSMQGPSVPQPAFAFSALDTDPSTGSWYLSLRAEIAPDGRAVPCVARVLEHNKVCVIAEKWLAKVREEKRLAAVTLAMWLAKRELPACRRGIALHACTVSLAPGCA